MRKLLLAATAVSGIALIATTAFAESEADYATRSQGQDNAEYLSKDLERQSPTVQENPAFAVRIAGTVRVDIQGVKQDVSGMRPNASIFDTRHDFSLLGAAIADNGLSYGFELDVGTRRGRVYGSSTYGRVDLGDAKSATQALVINGGSAMVGTGHFARAGNTLVNSGSLAGMRVVSYRGQGGTIRYTTPNVGGLTLSASYTRESDTDRRDGANALSQVLLANHQVGYQWVGSEDIFSAAAQHVSAYGPYTTVFYAGYEHSSNNNKLRFLTDDTLTVNSLPPGPTPFGNVGAVVLGPLAQSSLNDQDLLSAGAKVSGNGSSFAVGYGHAYHETPAGFGNDRKWFDVGAGYDYGAWAFSVGAAYLEDEETIALGNVIEGHSQAYSASFNYNLAPGLLLMGGVSHHIIESTLFNADPNSLARAFFNVGPDPVRGDNEATTFTLSTQVSF